MPSSNEEIIEFDSLTRITQMIFTPSGYSVQIKDENRDIIWEDGVSLEQGGSKIGHKCYTVNFGRSEPCPNCLLLKTKILGLSAVKEDRHLGDGKWYRVLALPILYQGKIMTLEFIKEITQEKQTQQQLKFVTSKDEFYMDVLVHDLLNYLSIANLALEELDQRPNPSSKNIGKFIKIAKQNTNKAINILAELRNLQFDADSELFPVPLVTILNETIAEVQTIYTEKEIYVDYKIGVKIQDATVLANELLSVLLLNILKNSVIHTLSNPVQIDIMINQSELDNELLEIKISDRGKGIHPGMRAILFDREARRQKGWRPREDSLGLGMNIIKTLVDLFGGIIKYDNRVAEDWGQGTTVTLILPQIVVS